MGPQTGWNPVKARSVGLTKKCNYMFVCNDIDRYPLGGKDLWNVFFVRLDAAFLQCCDCSLMIPTLIHTDLPSFYSVILYTCSFKFLKHFYITIVRSLEVGLVGRFPLVGPPGNRLSEARRSSDPAVL